MFVDVTAAGTEICEPTVLTSLSVTAAADVDLVAALGDLGTVDEGGDHVWLSVESLRRRAGELVPADEVAAWSTAFDGMVGYATSKGWTSPDGTHLRAHVTRPA